MTDMAPDIVTVDENIITVTMSGAFNIEGILRYTF